MLQSVEAQWHQPQQQTKRISIGHIAGAALTTGDYNTFIGGGAGTATTTASSNVAIGNGSFYGNTTGGYNTAVGTIWCIHHCIALISMGTH